MLRLLGRCPIGRGSTLLLWCCAAVSSLLSAGCLGEAALLLGATVCALLRGGCICTLLGGRTICTLLGGGSICTLLLGGSVSTLRLGGSVSTLLLRGATSSIRTLQVGVSRLRVTEG